MTATNILGFSEPLGKMTFAEGLSFIERTRRQVDRFDDALPHPSGETIDPMEADAIRSMCDELEADINRSLKSA